LFVGGPQGTGTLAISSFSFYLFIQSKGVVKEVMLRGVGDSGPESPKGPRSRIVIETEKEKNLHKAAVLAFLVAASLMPTPRFVALHPAKPAVVLSMAFYAAGLPGPTRASAFVSRFQIICIVSDTNGDGFMSTCKTTRHFTSVPVFMSTCRTTRRFTSVPVLR
jgi:hypothetical protein